MHTSAFLKVGGFLLHTLPDLLCTKKVSRKLIIFCVLHRGWSLALPWKTALLLWHVLLHGEMVQVSFSNELFVALGVVGRSSIGLLSEYYLHWSSILLLENSLLLLVMKLLWKQKLGFFMWCRFPSASTECLLIIAVMCPFLKLVVLIHWLFGGFMNVCSCNEWHSYLLYSRCRSYLTDLVAIVQRRGL